MRLKRAALAAPLVIASSVACAQGQVTTNELNPAISLILNGHVSSYSLDPDGYFLPGFLLDEEAGLAPEGLSLDETELAMSANVDDKFYGFLTASLEHTADETSIELEEAYFETLALPKGLKIKAGQFLSDIGYLNPIHPHAWDFYDAPLAYIAMLNGGLSDAGVQLRWVVPTTLFIEIGGELLRGDAFPAADGAASDGTGAGTLFVHFGGDVGATSSWRAGISRLSADASERVASFADTSVSFTGTSDVTIADFVWKWARNGNARDRNYIVQAEYFDRDENGDIVVATPSSATAPESYVAAQSGFYVQGVYQFRPRWRAGVRYDRLDAGDGIAAGTPPELAASHRPSRLTAMTDFSNSEFSRLRLQLSRDDSRPETDDQIVVQYLMSLGAHGAHRF
jgi:hypothetical protein